MFEEERPELGWIGLGGFGRFFLPYLTPHFQVTVTDAVELSGVADELGLRWGSLSEVATKPIVILAVPVQFLREVIGAIAPHVAPDALVCDVSSVKVQPIAWMEELLPAAAQIVGLHPLFGPQSGRHGIQGLQIVACPVRTACWSEIHQFLSEILGLSVVECSADDHDRQMAYVQALNHFVARGLQSLQIPDCALTTPAYEALQTVRTFLGNDSWDLFLTIQRENPYAEQVRFDFRTALEQLDQQIRSPSDKAR